MLFSHLIGNQLIKDQLQHMVGSHTLPSVLLFHGPTGVGKRRFAEELALHLLASSGPADKHPDLHQIFPDKNGLHSIVSMREFIAETTLPPYTAAVKVFIIHNAEKMLATSSNALLKTLEEPPASTWIILLATDISAMLPTVLSRCRPLAFRPLSSANITTYLANRYGEAAEAHQVHFAEGSLEKLEVLRAKMDDPKTAILLDMLQIGLWRDCNHWYGHFLRLEEMLKENKKDDSVLEEQLGEQKGEALFTTLLYWMRDLSLLQAGGRGAQLYHLQHQSTLERQAKELKPQPLTRVYRIFEQAQTRLACNMRLAPVLEECLFQLHRLYI